LKRERLIDAAFIAIAVAVAAIAAAQSWNGWLDPIVDTGRDLYIPAQLRHGTKLYRDILYYYPPLTPYLLAGLTAVTGSSIAAYTAIGGLIAVATIVALYALGTICCGRLSGLGAALLFAACSVAGRSTWGTNYFFPWAHAATLGMLFFIVFVSCLSAYLYVARRPGWIVASLAFALAASWTKLEYAVWTAVVILFAFVVHRLALRWLSAYLVAFGLSIGAVTVFFRDAPPGRHWFFDNVAPQTMVRSPYLRAFYRAVAGLDRWPSLLGRSIVAALLLFAFVALLRLGSDSNVRARRILMFTGAAVAAAALLIEEDGFFRAWTVLQLVLIPVALRRPREPLALILLVSLCTTSRVFFNIVPVWYGFVFVVPAYALITCVLLRYAPPRLAFILIAAVSVSSLVSAHRTYALKKHPIVTPRGTIYDALADRTAAISELGRFAAATHMRSLVVIPEGLALNYLLAIPTPLAYYTFTPPESADPGVEARIVEEFERKRPEWIVLVPRRLEEFGVRQFGVDYDRGLASYLRERYGVARAITRPQYRMLVLRRRPHS
jgi:hypothetical protein